MLIAGGLAAATVWLLWPPVPPRAAHWSVTRGPRPSRVPPAEASHLLALVHIEVSAGSLPRAAWSAALAAMPDLALPATRTALALDGDLPAALVADATGAPELALAALVTRVCAATGAPPSEALGLAWAAAREIGRAHV